jgi:hypothetical protein
MKPTTVATTGEGNRYKLPRSGDPEGGPGPDNVAYGFVFLGSIIICQFYKLTLSDHPSHSATDSHSSRFSV